MGNVNAILSARLKKSESSSKMAALAKQSAEGNLTTFAGLFSVTDLSDREKESLEELLKEYGREEQNHSADLSALISITSEVKAINNQAAILHGERIKKAHTILTKYRDGAFTAWLIATYGNRQTPYNLMQYYEFYESLPKNLRVQIEAMPRQAVYTLASREGDFDKKLLIIEKYQGQTKVELLQLIREAFPLDKLDKRGSDIGETTLSSLQRIVVNLQRKRVTLSVEQKQTFTDILRQLQLIVDAK